jgi:hypothetical protein
MSRLARRGSAINPALAQDLILTEGLAIDGWAHLSDATDVLARAERAAGPDTRRRAAVAVRELLRARVHARRALAALAPDLKAAGRLCGPAGEPPF